MTGNLTGNSGNSPLPSAPLRSSPRLYLLRSQASWTWAKDIEDLNGFLFESTENAYDRLRERGNSLDTPRHRVTTNTIFDLPFGSSKRYFGNAGKGWNALVGDWESSWIFSYYFGQFLIRCGAVPIRRERPLPRTAPPRM
jgi:hypothetical protein